MISCFAVFTGAFLQCSSCTSSVSYEDCQNKTTVENCSSANDHACFQANVKFEKLGSDTIKSFEKGCLQIKDCETYNKGEIGDCISAKQQGYDVDCKAKCCHEDECNKENLLDQDKDNKGSAFAISVIILLSGLLLTLVNIN